MWASVFSVAAVFIAFLLGLLQGHIEWRRAAQDRAITDRREMYAACLVTIRQAHEAIRFAATHASRRERKKAVDEAFLASGCDEARERLLLLVPATDPVAEAVTKSLATLREVRKALAMGYPGGEGAEESKPYEEAREEHGLATRAARILLRLDLSKR